MANDVIQRGETIVLRLPNPDGIVPDTIVAKVRPTLNGEALEAPATSLTVEAVADLGDDLGPGWVCTGSSSALTGKSYVADAKITMGSQTIISDPIHFLVARSASGV